MINQGSSISGLTDMAFNAQDRADCLFPLRNSFFAIWMAYSATVLSDGILGQL